MIEALLLGIALLLPSAGAALGNEPRLVAFDEPGFPALGLAAPAPVPENAFVATDGASLNEALATGGVLVWRHGSAFPQESWRAIVTFLERGGSWLQLGGEPFTEPIAGQVGARSRCGRTLGPLRELLLLRPQPLAAGGSVETWVSALAPDGAPRALRDTARVTVLEPRFTTTAEFPDEEGSPGPREALVRPLAGLRRLDTNAVRPFASSAYAIDRVRGRFAGGRWVLYLVDEAPPPECTSKLLAEACREPIEVLANPIHAVVRDDERAVIRVRVTRPRAEAIATDFSLSLLREGKTPAAQLRGTLAPGATATTVEMPRVTVPGLYRVIIDGFECGPIETGFLQTTAQLLTGGNRLTTDASHLRRGRNALAGVGTTMMSPDVHRAFLFEPNPALWDDAFAELEANSIDLVRTGLWYGWDRVIDDAGTVDESFLRALEAYYLCARRHDVALVFNVFAFLPPRFGGSHAYLDERSLAQQRRLVSAIAERFRDAREFAIDLINEPSFAPPSLVWRSRPAGDPVERDAFRAWLEARDSAPGVDWQQAVRTRWQLPPDAAIDLPDLRDFDEAQVFGERRPMRALDFLRFSQDAFTGWTNALADAIRATGSEALITVGQDEGGLLERPHPLLHGSRLAFTSIHTWWWNDAQLFDVVASKARERPLVVSETGIQPRERRDGASQRDPVTSARLLSRKLAVAHAGRAGAVIQWCYHVNPYLASDAEAGIGLVRVDGSGTPELEVLRRYAAFAKRNAGKFGPFDAPEIDLVLPNSDYNGPRAIAKDGVSRTIERLTYGLALGVQAVPEWDPATLGARVVVLPAARHYDERLLAALRERLAAGATVIASGFPRAADGSPAFPELQVAPRALGRREVVAVGGRELAVEFPLAIYESLDAADATTIVRAKIGGGEIVLCPVPLEHALGADAALDAFLAEAVVGASVAPKQIGVPPHSPVDVAYVSIDGGKRVLVVAINETMQERAVSIALAAHPERSTELRVAAGEGRLLLLDAKGATIDVLDEP